VTPLEWVIAIIGPILIIMAFSYSLLGDTYAFSFAENTFVGATVGYTMLSVFRSLLGMPGKPIMAGEWWLIIPLIVGILSFSRLTRFRWMARYPVAILSGVGVAVVMTNTLRADILVAVTDTATKLKTLSPDPASAVIILVGVLSTLTYFLYSARLSAPFYSERGRFRWVVRLGRLFMMCAFGVLYARIFVLEGMDALIIMFTHVIKRTMDRFLTGVF
jgi:hypothetical protein